MPAQKRSQPIQRFQVFCNLVDDHLNTQNYKVITAFTKKLGFQTALNRTETVVSWFSLTGRIFNSVLEEQESASAALQLSYLHWHIRQFPFRFVSSNNYFITRTKQKKTTPVGQQLVIMA